MSGGVDSSVAAALLAEAGHEVVGVTMRVVAEEEFQSVYSPCCSTEMASDARQVAEKLGFQHFTFNYVKDFEEAVIGDFTSEYAAGRTPNPCVRCNQRLKFGGLFEKAQEFGCGCIATGHYIRLAQRDGRYAVQRAVYLPKDQSYVMAGLNQTQLSYCLFPLGEMTKAQTREKARELGLAAAERPESQDICFVPGGDYRDFLRQRTVAAEPGPIIDTNGIELGRHQGLPFYTVGQRRGLGIAAARPLYVVRLEPARNAVVVGYEEETFCERFTAREAVWSGLAPQAESFECLVQIRYHHLPIPSTVTAETDGFRVHLHTPQRSVTPGQWAVCYDEEGRTLLAGIIDRFERAA
jgi:tRNA-specific 2-thiouridylase